jgi:hypothetical protein
VTRHPRRVIPATLVALVVLAASVIAVISVIQNLAHQPQLVSLDLLNRHLGGLHLDGMVMTTAGILAAVFGLILLAYAVLPGPAQTLALAPVEDEPAGSELATVGLGQAELGRPDRGGTDVAVATRAGQAGGGRLDASEAVAGVSRTGLRAALAETVTDTDGVEAVRVRVGRRYADLRVRTELTDTTALRPAAVAAAERRLAQAGLARPLRVRLKVQTIRRGAAV